MRASCATENRIAFCDHALPHTGRCPGVQVGSKNAAFYMGRCIRVATKPADSAYVHELGIAAEALEARYRDGQARTEAGG